MTEADRPLLHPEALAEARVAFLWHRERSVGCSSVAAEIDSAIAHIAEAPDRWPTGRAGTRRYLLRPFPFLVVYRRIEDTILILSVAHARRRPGYWRDRKA